MPGYITGTAVPAAVYALCPRCSAQHYFRPLGPLGSFICEGCEYQFTLGAGASPINTSASVSAGGVSLPFASGGTALAYGSTLWISDTTLTEVVVVTGAPTATAVPISPLANAHGSGKAVSIAALTQTFLM